MNRKDRRREPERRSAAQARAAEPSAPLDQLAAVAFGHLTAGRLAEAEHGFRQVLAVSPKHPDSLNGLGILAHQCGHPEAAIALIRQAIAVDGRVAHYHYSLGLVFAALGRMDDAVAHNRRAVALAPDFADAHTNLAGALTAQGRVSEAVHHFRLALMQRPDWPPAHNNLATALLADGKPEKALRILVRGLSIKETGALKNIFALCLCRLESLPRIDGIAGLVERAMAECWARPEEFARLFTGLIGQNEVLAALIARCGHALRASPDALGWDDLERMAGDRLLRCYMVTVPVCDIGLERLLTHARAALLDLAATQAASTISDAGLSFCCALAQQCFINEYVFASSSEEQERAGALRDRLASALAAGDGVPALTVAAVAAYFPLHSLDVAPACFDRPWPEAVARLVIQQVREPAEEQSLRATMPVLTPIVDSVSAAVQRQYEENPYPRWTATSSLDTELSFDALIASQFPRAAFAKLGKIDFDMLIAGCGSGRNAIEAARRHPHARVLAVDLSLTSLSYGARKARELGLGNLSFGQADILALASLGRTFDVIEAMGVLHHLRDPLEGWRTLVGLLRPGGFMRVGLYSALARRHIGAARAFIDERRYASTAESIRQCRQDLLGFAAGTPLRKATESFDFFTTSRCRDLLFHVQEHHTDIPAIKAFLAENKLHFLGFEGVTDPRYAQRHPDDKGMTDLDRWHQCETDHPETFIRMYQFWLQRPALAAAAGA
jgi:tetratricopeptide (TPR) repeat protein/SAM-dependent methyltransferase